MVKVKRLRTADRVVGGFRWSQAASAAGGAARPGDAAPEAAPGGAAPPASGRQVGSLLLGLYDSQGRLDRVGFSASFTAAERHQLAAILTPHIGPPGFTGRAPGGPSRWSQGRSTEWVPLRPSLVCEVSYDHFSGERFRHGARFLRWRPDKAPAACTFDQLHTSAAPLAALHLEPARLN